MLDEKVSENAGNSLEGASCSVCDPLVTFLSYEAENSIFSSKKTVSSRIRNFLTVFCFWNSKITWLLR